MFMTELLFCNFNIIIVFNNNNKNVNPSGPMVIILVTGSEVCRFKPGWGQWIFSERINPEYDFLQKGSKDLQHVKEPKAKIRASEQNLSAFSRSL